MNFATPAKSKSGKYLFVYFVGNEPEEERIHFAVSEDGYNFVSLNNNEPVIIQTKGKKCVRDPYILKGQDGFYYIIGTDMKCIEGWTSNFSLVTWKSRDLITWTDETIIDMRQFGGDFATTTRAWAPQAYWDKTENAYMIYWAHSDEKNDVAQMYYAYTTDFKTITEPKLLFERPGIQTIDGDIAYSEINHKYYLYFKHDEDQTIAYVTADKLNGPYCDDAFVVSLAKTGVEGSEIYNITGTNEWVMIMDEYGTDRFFMQQTTDFENFLPVNPDDYSMSFNPRHGSVVAISDEDYARLIEKYNK
ncbi:MAG: glycoside hydrolase family 43 protein [Clostridia bacterium]|nr:glycoside hydrolase family 43 protein [Clostridia bacterium]